MPDHHLDDAASLAVALGRAPDRARAHVRSCPVCRARVAEWSATRAAAAVVAATVARPVPPDLLDRTLAAARGTATAPGRGGVGWRPTTRIPSPPAGRWAAGRARVGWAGQLLRAQVPLLRDTVISGAALLFAVGGMVVLAARTGRATDVLAAVAPVIAAVGVAVMHGPETDPAVEVTCATGTSPRVVLLARLVLVTAFDLTVALAATALTRLVASRSGFGELVVSWFGPLLLLSAVSLLLAVLVRPAVGMGVALGAWVLHLSVVPDPVFVFPLPVSFPSRVVGVLQQAGSTSLPTVVTALGLVALTLAVAPRRLRLPA